MNVSSVTPSGRRLFPHFDVLIDHLDPSAIYDIYMDFIVRGRYIWNGSEWIKTHDVSLDTGRCNCGCVQQYQAYLHPASPNLGMFWMTTPVSFAHLKITNRTADFTPGQVSIHK